MNQKEPILVGRFWHFPDGYVAPNIYGADGEGDDTAAAAAALAKSEENVKAANKEAAGYRTKLRALEDKVEAMGSVDTEEYNTLKKNAEDAKTKKAEEEGKYKELMDESTRRHEKALEKANETGNAWKGRYEKIMVDNALLASANEAVDPNAAVTLVRANHEFMIAEDGSVEIKKAGEVMLADDGKPLTPAHLMVTYLESHPFLVKAQNKDGGGSPPNGGDKSKNTDGMTSQQKIAQGLKDMGK